MRPRADDERTLGRDHALAVAHGRLVQGGGREVGDDLAGPHARARTGRTGTRRVGRGVGHGGHLASVSCSGDRMAFAGRRASIRPAARDTVPSPTGVGFRSRCCEHGSTRTACPESADGHGRVAGPWRIRRAIRLPSSAWREVLDEVGGALDADRQADERLGDLEARAGHGQVGHHGRQLDQRLDAAERLGEREDPCRLADGDRPLARGTTARAPPARTRPSRRRRASGARRTPPADGRAARSARPG